MMLAVHPALADRSRLVRGASHLNAVQPWEVAILAGCGLLAAATVILLDFSLKIPGHAILRSVIPMSFGLAMVPRRGAGFTMSCAALLGLLIARGTGLSAGTGATTSLLATGPLLDIATRMASRGWQLTTSFGIAALLSNLLAFAVRGATRLPMGSGGGGGAGRGGGAGWWSIAPVTYALCGIVAGVVCALIWFRWGDGASDQPQDRDGAP